MSKKAKQASKQKNLMAKRARKAANRSRFQKMRESGQNSKTKHSRAVNKRDRKVKNVDHADGHCGNFACTKCFPNVNRNLTAKYVKPQKIAA
jgi:hypothetical protein